MNNLQLKNEMINNVLKYGPVWTLQKNKNKICKWLKEHMKRVGALSVKHQTVNIFYFKGHIVSVAILTLSLSSYR